MIRRFIDFITGRTRRLEAQRAVEGEQVRVMQQEISEYRKRAKRRMETAAKIAAAVEPTINKYKPKTLDEELTLPTAPSEVRRREANAVRREAVAAGRKAAEEARRQREEDDERRRRDNDILNPLNPVSPLNPLSPVSPIWIGNSAPSCETPSSSSSYDSSSSSSDGGGGGSCD